MLHSTRRKKDRGFSLIEMIIVAVIIMILAAITVPRILNTISDAKLRYFATNYSGLLQSARMQAVRKNAFYMVTSTALPTGGTGYYFHFEGGTYPPTHPLLPPPRNLPLHPRPRTVPPTQ